MLEVRIHRLCSLGPGWWGWERKNPSPRLFLLLRLPTVHDTWLCPIPVSAPVIFSDSHSPNYLPSALSSSENPGWSSTSRVLTSSYLQSHLALSEEFNFLGSEILPTTCPKNPLSFAMIYSVCLDPMLAHSRFHNIKRHLQWAGPVVFPDCS